MRGITPIIAIILLLLITIAAAGAAYIWIAMIQRQIATQAESGLETNLKQMHGRVSMESVWNDSLVICASLRNSGTISYTENDLKQLTFYINSRPARYNTTTIVGYGELAAGDVVTICLCKTAEQTSSNCSGPTPNGYDYIGGSIDVEVQPSVGAGDTYSGYTG